MIVKAKGSFYVKKTREERKKLNPCEDCAGKEHCRSFRIVRESEKNGNNDCGFEYVFKKIEIDFFKKRW